MSQIYDIFRRAIGITKEQFRNDYGSNEIEKWDSLGHLHLISQLEDEFDVEFDIKQINSMKTIGDVKDALADIGIKLDD